MDKINDGGPAFPFIEQNADGSPYTQTPGMSLRDHFAGQALALLGGRAWDHIEGSDRAIVKAWAQTAYVVADAMLAAREGR